jgi:hypothetical protein
VVVFFLYIALLGVTQGWGMIWVTVKVELKKIFSSTFYIHTHKKKKDRGNRTYIPYPSNVTL